MPLLMLLAMGQPISNDVRPGGDVTCDIRNDGRTLATTNDSAEITDSGDIIEHIPCEECGGNVAWGPNGICH